MEELNQLKGCKLAGKTIDNVYHLVRISKYEKEDKSYFFRISVYKEDTKLEMEEDISEFDKAKKLYESWQKKYLGKIESNVNLNDI